MTPSRPGRRAILRTLGSLGLVVAGRRLGLAAPLAIGPVPSEENEQASLAFTFRTEAFALRTLAPAERPYASTQVLPLVDPPYHDEDGVLLVLINGTLYDHPVGQATWGLLMLNSYNLTGNVAYLDKAEIQAGGLIRRAVAARDAWYFPYPFDFPLHSNPAATLDAPWYSAMAQGQALSLFVRLYEATGEAVYLQAADKAFASFKYPREVGVPWVVFVDAEGYLWLEEYAPGSGDRTYNGHVFAVYGLWDYHRLTDDATARLLLLGGLANARRALGQIRAPAWISGYCVSHQVRDRYYHQVHVDLALMCYRLTGHLGFARSADVLRSDYPDYRISGVARFTAGTHTGYQFNAAGQPTGTRTITLASTSSAHFRSRRRILGQPGVWYDISDGWLAGYFVREVPLRVYVPGLLASWLAYNPRRYVILAPGSHTGYRFDSGGGVTGTRTIQVPETTLTATNMRGVINGIEYLAIVTGDLAGYWLRLQLGVTY